MNKLTRSIGVLLLGIAIISMLATGCKKKEIQGPKGEAGAAGGGGNSSISSSDIFVILSSQWKSNADSSAWEVTINSALITQNVVDKGAVKVYVHLGTSWWELPYTERDLFTQFSFTAGSVKLTFMDIHGGLPTKPLTTEYRLVTVSEAAKSSNLYTGNPSPAILLHPSK